MEPLRDTVVGGIAYPLNSKRLKLRHIQHLASALNLPTTATRSDLEVMISGKISETSHDATSIQVVIVQSEEGEYLSLRDIKGTFLVTPLLPVVTSRSPTPSQENSDLKEEAESFTAEMTQLENVLQLLEEETTFLRTELQSTKEEVRQLRTELDRVNCRLVELWQENCKQLLDHDVAMTEKEREMQLLREQLQIREMELAGLKVAHLREAAMSNCTSSPEICSQAVITDNHSNGLSTQTIKPSMMQSTTIPARGNQFPSLRTTRGDMPTSFAEEVSQRVPSGTDAYLSTRKVEQKGHVFTSATTTTTNFSPSEHVITSSVTTTTNLSHYVVTSSTNPFQGAAETQMVDSEGTAVSDQGSTLQYQSNQQVTNLSTPFSDALYISRPVSSVGTLDRGKLTADSHAYISLIPNDVTK